MLTNGRVTIRFGIVLFARSVWLRSLLRIRKFVRNKDNFSKNMELYKFGRYFVNIRNPHSPIMFILVDCFLKNDSFLSERDLAMSKMINFYYCFHNYPLGEASLSG